MVRVRVGKGNSLLQMRQGFFVSGSPQKEGEMQKWRAAILWILFALWLPGNLFGEEGIEETVGSLIGLPFETIVQLGRIFVTPSRLPGRAEELYLSPSHVTVVTQEEIRRSKAQNLPQVLRQVEGINLFDATGNNQDLLVSLRGFSQGEDVVVLVDGVRVNEPDANNMIFPLIPLENIERIEIIRGSSSAVYGDGVFSGVIHILTKGIPEKKETFYEEFYKFGSFQSHQFLSRTGGVAGPTTWSMAWIRDLTDGYRSHGGMQATSLDTKWEIHSEDKNSSATLLLKNVDESIENPGFLTKNEMAADRRQSRNPRDGREIFNTVVSVNLAHALDEGISTRANLFFRENSLDFVTTSRTFPTLAGTDEIITDTLQKGFVFETAYEREIAMTEHHLVAGVEFSKSVEDDRQFDVTGTTRSAQTTDHVTDKDTVGVFGQYDFDLYEWLRVNAGIRYDEVDFTHRDGATPSDNADNEFSFVSPKAGVVLRPWKDLSLFGNISRSFKSPNVTDLFAFAGVGGSNPQLGPEKGENFDGGARFSLRDRLVGSFSYYRINLEDEIEFNVAAADTSAPFGKFDNVAKTRRHGVECSLKGEIIRGLDSYLTYTFTDATFRSGSNSGKKIPLVPAHQFTGGVSYSPHPNLSLHADLLFVGEQFVLGDEANQNPKLERYTVVNTWATFRHRDAELFFRVNNLFDRLYDTRAVRIGFAEDGSGFSAGDYFFTPAPERNMTVGVRITF